MAVRRASLVGGAALLLFAATLALYWPGYASFDTVVQYRQLLSGDYDDWHPPIMAQTWALLGGRALGTAPMFLLQMALYWLGLGLIAARLAQMGRRVAPWAVLALGLVPPLLGWQVVVLKDGQMTGAMMAAAGLACWWRLAGRAVPGVAWGLIVLLLLYAALVRANGAMAVVPFAVMLIERPLRPWQRGLAMLAGIIALLGVAPLVNHQLLGVRDSGVARSQALYDLAGIAVRLPVPDVAGLDPAGVAALRANDCATPLYWDKLGEGACEEAVTRWQHWAPSVLYRTLAITALHHPLAYAAQRLAHLNSTERWLVARNWPGAVPIAGNEPNRLGLVAPGRGALHAQRLAGAIADTPLGWPICYSALALLAILSAARRPPSPDRALGLALLASALVLEASFALISIASDLRYHLWPMLATGLALALIMRPRLNRATAGAGAILALIIGAGLLARATLPPVIATFPIPPGGPTLESHKAPLPQHG